MAERERLEQVADSPNDRPFRRDPVERILPLSLLSFTRSHSVLVARVYTKNIRSGRTWSPRGTRYQSASRNTASRWRVPRAQLLFTHKPVWSGSLAVVAAVEGEDERVHDDWLPRRRDWSGRWEMLDE